MLPRGPAGAIRSASAPLPFVFLDSKFSTKPKPKAVHFVSHLNICSALCPRWWFEVVDLYRRIIFLGVIPLLGNDSAGRAYAGATLALLSTVLFRETMPFKLQATSVLGVISQYAILMAFLAALMISTGSLDQLGLSNLLIGSILSATHIFIMFVALGIGYTRYKLENALMKSEHEAKIIKIEWAVHFSANKFNTTFEYVELHSVADSHILVFYYTSLAQARAIVVDERIPAVSMPNIAEGTGIHCNGGLRHGGGGIVVSLRGPQVVKKGDPSLSLMGTGSVAESREVVFCLSLPRTALFHLPAHGLNNQSTLHEVAHLRFIPANFLQAMGSYTRPLMSGNDGWSAPGKGAELLNPLVFLPSTSVLRAYQLYDNHACHEPAIPALLLHRERPPIPAPSTKSMVVNRKSAKKGKQEVFPAATVEVMRPATCRDYLDQMAKVREACKAEGTVPLYHFTMPVIAPFIQRDGFRMSTQGQGDGGVYFSTLGPASYGLGSPEYEANIIVDCFGKERLEEYIGKGKLDLVFVYGVDPKVLFF